MTQKAVEAIRFAIELLQERGHARNEDCHEFEGGRGYCVGMSVILGGAADGKSHAKVRKSLGCDFATIWYDVGVGNALAGMEAWYEARRYVAWAWGMPREEEPNKWGEEAAVTPNQWAKRHGVDPVPYLENAICIAEGKPLLYYLPALPCWARCEEPFCGKMLNAPVDEWCDEHNPFNSARLLSVAGGSYGER